MESTHSTLATLEGALIKLRSAFDANRISGEQFARGALYLEGRIESIRAELAEEDDEDEDKGTCDDCGSPLETCCDGIIRCLDCNPCPACHDGGMDDDEPDEDDITTSDGRTFYQYGKLWLKVSDPEDAPDAIRSKMDEEGFYPSVWSISDHGNANPFTLD